jgi:hypothetical protein
MNARYEQTAETIDKLMKYGWYKDIKDAKHIKVNYLENYPALPRTIADVDKNEDTTATPDSIYIKMTSDTDEDSTAVADSAAISESVPTH